MSRVKIEGLSKGFGSVNVLNNIDIDIKDGSFSVLLGPSGCGKSTLLRIIAGLEKNDNGNIIIGSREVSAVEPGKRNIAMVFQNYALYPHLTVYKNIEYGLKARKVPKAERKKMVDEAVEMVRLGDQISKLPSQMSGGQRQRVALARAIVKRPEVFLMDEPLSNLDAKLRTVMRTELIDLYKKLNTTFLYVTHDQVEAMSMGTNIIILDKGVVQQQGSPREIYENPSNCFVAGFIGSPPANIVDLGTFRYAVRPEVITMNTKEHACSIIIQGTISSSEHLGFEAIHNIHTDFGNIQVKTANIWNDIRNESVRLSVKPEDIMYFDEKGARLVSPEQKKDALHFLVQNSSVKYQQLQPASV